MSVLDDLKPILHILVDAAVGAAPIPEAGAVHAAIDAIGETVEEVHAVRQEEHATEPPAPAVPEPAPEPVPAPLPEPVPPVPFGSETNPFG